MLPRWRINLFIFLLFFAASLVFYRLFYLAYIQHGYFTEAAESQYKKQKSSVARRGNIYIESLNSTEKQLVAAQKSFPYIYILPAESKDVVESAKKLSEITKIPEEESLKLFSDKKETFKIVEKNPSEEKVDLLRSLSLKEIGIGYEEKRHYPEGDFLSHALGFLGFDGDNRVGQYGVESFYDNELIGEEGGQEGSDLVLTVEKDVQLMAQKELDYLMKKWRPSSGLILVQDPQTGGILAMAGSPSFDPNNYGKYRLENFTNKAVQEMFEPGSSFKPFTVGSALDQKKITPETTYFDTGEVEIAGYKIKNFNEKSFGTQTMNQVLEKSLNTGAIFVEGKLGDENFLNYMLNFGFGQATGIDLAGEVAGDISNLYSKRKINFATASFGQGIAVTPIQLVTAYSALANGGRLYKPFIVKEIIKPDGSRKETHSELVGTPISERTSSQIKAMLVKVVENGFDKATVAGYDVAGKTGTAQIPSKSGGYSEDFIHDIVGFAPAFSPKFVVLIKLEKPQGTKFASDSLSPSLGKIIKFLLNYFQVPPTRQ